MPGWSSAEGVERHGWVPGTSNIFPGAKYTLPLYRNLTPSGLLTVTVNGGVPHNLRFCEPRGIILSLILKKTSIFSFTNNLSKASLTSTADFRSMIRVRIVTSSELFAGTTGSGFSQWSCHWNSAIRDQTLLKYFSECWSCPLGCFWKTSFIGGLYWTAAIRKNALPNFMMN